MVSTNFNRWRSNPEILRDRTKLPDKKRFDLLCAQLMMMIFENDLCNGKFRNTVNALLIAQKSRGIEYLNSIYVFGIIFSHSVQIQMLGRHS